jgi:membrane protein YqaA with SNARE-associated domain
MPTSSTPTPHPPEPVASGTNLIALTWGFAEATLFFIVPDVWLTWTALRNARAAGVACLWALTGTLIGGAAMYAWAALDAAAARAAVARVPGVGQVMVERVGEQVRSDGAAAVLAGPLTGTPYKLYAVQAGAGGLPPGRFLLASVPARLGRFAAVTAGAVLLNRLLRRWPLAVRRALHLALWGTFYGWYFWHFGGRP